MYATITGSELIKQILIDSIEDLRANDSYLVEHDVHERTICAHLANYLERRIKRVNPELSVDCEYNRNGIDPKKLSRDFGEKHDVFPDIIVHKRGSNEFNIIVIEVKKSNCTSDDEEKDVRKLKAFTVSGESGQYKYEIGVFLIVGFDSECNCMEYRLRLFSDGEET